MEQPNKTYKREIAVVLLLCWAGMGVAGIWEPEAQRTFEFITLPIFTFAGGAFALDSTFKQGGYTK